MHVSRKNELYIDTCVRSDHGFAKNRIGAVAQGEEHYPKITGDSYVKKMTFSPPILVQKLLFLLKMSFLNHFSVFGRKLSEGGSGLGWLAL
jgi:hypothetical protein